MSIGADSIQSQYNDCLDRASAYRHRKGHFLRVEGDQFLIDHAQDPHEKGGLSVLGLVLPAVEIVRYAFFEDCRDAQMVYYTYIFPFF